MTDRKFNVGDLFTVDPSIFPAACHGVVYRVEKVPAGSRGVNYTGRPVNGGRGVRAPEYAMRSADAETPNVADGPLGHTLGPIVHAGTVVQVKADAPSGRLPRLGLFVVLDHARNKPDAVKLARLGGDGGRYWRAVPLAWLDVIEPERLNVA